MKSSLAIALFLATLVSCTTTDKQKEKEAIQALIDQVTAAHFEKDGVKFYAPNAPKWWDIRKGQIAEISKAEAIPRTQSYLDNMEFLELRPSHTPIIEISNDGSMASYIGAIHLKGSYDGQPVFWVVSWQSILKKVNDQWQIIQTANTEMPKAQMASVILEKAEAHIAQAEQLNAITSISTLAEGSGPTGAFKTLLMSDAKNTRFEQKGTKYHSILALNENRTWFASPPSQEIKENLDTLTQLFIQGHELHWLSLFPTTRFQNPAFKAFREFAGKTSFELEFKDKLNRPVLFYYDFETYQPLGFVMHTAPLVENKTVVVTFEKWETIEGITTFKQATFKEGGNIFEYDFQKIEWNQVTERDFSNQNKKL